MSFYTDWFIADEGDAEAIASIITTEEKSHNDWPNLALRNIGELELIALYDLLKPGRDGGKCVSGTLLFTGGDEGPFVSRVEPLFVESLAAINKRNVPDLAKRWLELEGLNFRAPSELKDVLQSLVRLVETAQKTGKPVLQMVVI